MPITKSVKRTAAVKRQPATVRAKVVKKTALRVAKSPRLTRKLAKPKPRVVRKVRRILLRGPGYALAGKRRSYTIPGPARVTISTL